VNAAVRFLESAAAFQQSQPPVVDTVHVESPLPGGPAQVFRYLFNNLPTWLQLSLAGVGAIAGLALVIIAFRRRAAIRAWFVARSKPVRIALAATAIVIVASAAAGGAMTWHYTQHENAFCTGCHVMHPAFRRFSLEDNKHGKLSCHNCHQQSLYASARQVYLWVAERPEKIGTHAKVPNKVCETCHVTQDTAKWRHIKSTAGHRVHLESDSASLKNLQCVTCHGQDVHRFKPVDKTCGQSGCHDLNKQAVVLGKMKIQNVRHCTACHGFTVDVPLLATRDSARGTLVPGKPQCLGCHEMNKVLADFDEHRDPHGGKCGLCHNPHKQETPHAAAQSCASAKCHDTWRNEPFHVGTNHKAIVTKTECITCHVPHHAKVDASDCEGCHKAVKERGGLHPPERFDTAAAAQRSRLRPPPRDTVPPPHGGGPFVPDPAGEDDVSTPADSFPKHAAPADTFPHASHRSLTCITCHQNGRGPGITFTRPRGCLLCHHQSPSDSKCATCHHDAQLSKPIPAALVVTVPSHPPSVRDVDFMHTRHSSRACVECHTTPVTLAPAPGKASCADCHAEHHAEGRDCTSCHHLTAPKAAHTTLAAAHQNCDACHTRSTVVRLTPDRNLCGTCHAAKKTGHYDARECTTCHFLVDPAAYRAHLVRGGTR